MRLLLSADLHLGRTTSGMPPSAGDALLELSCREAWTRMVDVAIREGVDALLLAGDLMEDSNAYYESLGPLVEGFERLGESGIQVFAVGGNHDARAFERLAEDCAGMAGVHFVGRRGKWERAGLTIEGTERLWIEGWSFPDLRYPSDPTAGYDLQARGGIPVVGMVHADLGSGESPYAPTTANALRGLPADFWLLGHIHKPSLDSRPGAAQILYPGSPQAMDFGETGWHGVWILDLGGGDLKVSRLQQVSTVRFEDKLSIEVAEDDDEEKVENLIKEAGNSYVDQLGDTERHALRCVVHRVELTGESRLGDLSSSLQGKLPELCMPRRDGVITCFGDKVFDRTHLPLDLDSYVQRGGAIGELANTLLELRNGDWRTAGWFSEIFGGLTEDYEQCRLTGDDVVRDDGTKPFGPPDREEVRDMLARRARELLLVAIGNGNEP